MSNFELLKVLGTGGNSFTFDFVVGNVFAQAYVVCQSTKSIDPETAD